MDTEQQKKQNGNGATVGLVVILIILIIGGIYVWQAKVKNLRNENSSQETPK